MHVLAAVSRIRVETERFRTQGRIRHDGAVGDRFGFAPAFVYVEEGAIGAVALGEVALRAEVECRAVGGVW